MASIIKDQSLSFDDVLIVPNSKSPVISRDDCSTSSFLHDEVYEEDGVCVTNTPIYLRVPIIASPMLDVCNEVSIKAMSWAGGIGCVHRFYPDFDSQLSVVRNLHRDIGSRFLAAVGTGECAVPYAKELIAAGAGGIIVDVAFLNKNTLRVCEELRTNLPNGTFIMSGNVATAQGFRDGVSVGLSAIRVGIGNGHACRTSRVTGVGVGIITSLMECREAALESETKIIVDGGMETEGSFCKAIAAGAHAALMGRVIAGSYESPAPIADYCRDGSMKPTKKYYRGSASLDAQLSYKDKDSVKYVEGASTTIPVTGSIQDILDGYRRALQSSMSYVGVTTLEGFRSHAVFRTVTGNVVDQQKARSNG